MLVQNMEVTLRALLSHLKFCLALKYFEILPLVETLLKIIVIMKFYSGIMLLTCGTHFLSSTPHKVIRDRRWKEITGAFRFPSSITSASFVLRKYYLSLLYHFEQVYYFRREEPSISVAGVLKILLLSASLLA